MKPRIEITLLVSSIVFGSTLIAVGAYFGFNGPKVAIFGPTGDKDSHLLGTQTASGNFPTSLLNPQDGDTINAGDFANIEGAIGTLTSTSTASLNYKMNNVTSSFLTQLLGQINSWTQTQTFTSVNITNGNEYRKRTATVVVMNPSATVHNTGTVAFGFPVDATLNGVECYSLPSGTSTIALDRRASSTPTIAGTSVLASIACGSANSTTTFSTSTMTEGSILNFTFTVAGAPSSTNLRVIYTTND